MTNFDKPDEKYLQSGDRLVEAAKSDDPNEFKAAMMQFASHVEKAVLEKAGAAMEERNDENDRAILLARGQRQLTSEEKKFYQKWIEAAGSANPKQALAELDVVLPKTTINDVFTDLTTEHALLDAIDFQNTGAVTEWLVNKNPNQLATWSPLCAEIVKELTSGFKNVNLTLSKLSAFIPVCRAMLDLGPEWLDRYVRTILEEALYLGLEDGIINGRGQVGDIHEPIGMKKDLSGNVSQTTGYPDKEAIEFTSFNPTAYGALLAKMAKTENGNARTVTGFILIVNPIDYFTKVFPATTVRTLDGGYNSNVLPFPTTVIQSTRITEGEAILGIASRYFMGVGTSRGGRIEYSDEYHFLERERIYLVELYGYGQPKDNNAFMRLDISNLQPEVTEVKVSGGAEGSSELIDALKQIAEAMAQTGDDTPEV